MNNVESLLTVVTTLAEVDPLVARTALESLPQDAPPGGQGDAPAVELDVLQNLVRQAPAAHADRLAMMRLIADVAASATPGQMAATGRLLRQNPPKFPDGGSVDLPALDGTLTSALVVLGDLDVRVREPWTLVGGLMVLLHCVAAGVPFGRPTADADVAVGVFTHRGALHQLTTALAAAGFEDVTPDPLGRGEPLGYRWSRHGVLVDVMVPPGVNSQERVPRTVRARPAVELPATQQALARSERLRLRLADNRQLTLRRPDLLGALVIKSVAAVSDTRDPARHRSDLVSLATVLAYTGGHMTYRGQLRAKDRDRLRVAERQITDAEWRQSPDVTAAREAWSLLLAAVS